MSKSACASDWMANLPLVLLGIRTSTRDNTCVSPAHLLYGGPHRLPGEFLALDLGSLSAKASDFVLHLQRSIRDTLPAPAEFHSPTRGRTTSIPAALASCQGVFVRVDAVKRPLTPPYVGPYRVLQRKRQDICFVESWEALDCFFGQAEAFLSTGYVCLTCSLQLFINTTSATCGHEPADIAISGHLVEDLSFWPPATTSGSLLPIVWALKICDLLQQRRKEACVCFCFDLHCVP